MSEILDRIMGQIAAIARRVAHLETLETPAGGGGAPSPHDILGAHHSISGGAALDLVGQSGTATIARVTPSADPGAASAVLKTTAAGLLSLEQLDVDQWIDMADDAWIGQPGAAGLSQRITFKADGDILVQLPGHGGQDFFEIEGDNSVTLLSMDSEGYLRILGPGAELYVAGDGLFGGEVYADQYHTAPYGVTAVFVQTGIADNVPTAVFTVTTTNESGDNDGGAYSVSVHALAAHAALKNSTNVAAQTYMGQFSRAMKNTGVGVNGTVASIVSSSSGATDPAARDIASITMDVVETSEYVQTVRFTIDLSGTDVTTAQVTVMVELVYAGFFSPPVLAAA